MKNNNLKNLLYIFFLILTLFGGLFIGFNLDKLDEKTDVIQPYLLDTKRLDNIEDISYASLFVDEILLYSFDDMNSGYIELTFAGYYTASDGFNIFLSHTGDFADFDFLSQDYILSYSSSYLTSDYFSFQFNYINFNTYDFIFKVFDNEGLDNNIIFEDTKRITLRYSSFPYSSFLFTAPKLLYYNDFQTLYYNLGYDEGIEIGKDLGVDEYLNSVESVQENFDNIWTIIKNATNSFLNIFTFPILPGIPFYVLVTIPFIILIIFFILKVVKK